MTDYRRPRGMRWQPQDVPPCFPELSYGLKACLIAAAAIVALWALGGCEAQAADLDPWGNEYPPQCSERALSTIHITVVRVSQSFLDKATKASDRTGVYMPSGAAAVRSDLSGYMLAETIRHEKCHAIMGEWHARD